MTPRRTTIPRRQPVEPIPRSARAVLPRSVGPVVLGGGKRLFEGFSSSLDLAHLGVRQSPHATFINYRVKRP